MTTSRIQRRMEEKSKKTIWLSLIGMIVVLFFAIVYGIPLFTKYVLFSGNDKSTVSTSSTKKDTISYVAPPVLDETFSATNSATVKLTGSAVKGQKVKLFVNGSTADEKNVDSSGTFTFDNITLKDGDNDIKTKAYTIDGKESGYSNDVTITYKNKGPNLTVDNPQDNQTFSGGNSSAIYVSGTTDSGSKVTVNGFWAITDSSGKFNYRLQLSSGGTDIKIISTDTAGNTTTVSRHVTYNP